MQSPINFSIHHIAIQTENFDKAFSFYANRLKLKVVKEPFSFKGKRTMAWLSAGDVMIELYTVKKNETPQRYDSRAVGPDHIAFEVLNLEDAIAYLSSSGVKILKHPFRPPVDDPNQPLVAFIEGPDGEEIEIREYVS